MNQSQLVLIRNKEGYWEDKTDEVVEYRHLSEVHRIQIRFESYAEKWFSYDMGRVHLLGKAITIHDPATVQLRVKGKVLRDVDEIVKYPDFYIVTSHGRRKPYPVSEVSVERNVACNPECQTALDYFRKVAELTGVQDEEDKSVLTKQFSYLERISDACVLAKFLVPEKALDTFEVQQPLIYPFGTNASQKIAVEKAFLSQMLFVQGPPGTGKTQTILNIVANAIRFGQTVAVVSNNNPAIQNVADKLEREGLGFLLAMLGRRENKDVFIDKQVAYPDWVKNPHEMSANVSQLESNLATLITTLNQLIQANNDRALLVTKISQIQTEFELHRRIEGTTPSELARSMLNRWSARDWLTLLIECEESDPITPTGVLRFIKELWRYGPWGRKRRRMLFAEGMMVLRSLYYEKYLTELQKELVQVERVLTENNFETVQQQVQDMSWQLLRNAIAARFHKSETRHKFSSRELWSKYDSFLEEYPVVLSTTHAIKNSLSPDCLYDLIIVDEASQVDVVTGVLALSCAKRAVVVGDEKQLPNVIKDGIKSRATRLWNDYELNCQAWNYASHSLLSSAKTMWPQAPNVMLKEHYRCHPKIAGFINQQFYDNQLIVMTSDQGEHDVMQVVLTVSGNHARGHANRRQADVIQQEVYPDLLGQGLNDIGVIAPFKDQVALLKETLGDEIEVATVDGFQGREKQAIIISTVENKIGRFVDESKRVNVAVSRAQRSLTVIMSDQKNNFDTNFGDLVRYIRYQQQVVRHSKVCSVFDLLYADYAHARKQFLDAHGRTSQWDSESLAEAVVQDVL
jgi:KaiC/GvpD/RAD55 family RecA-like ATPase